jgi:REP element-mobilizing transposase RayT
MKSNKKIDYYPKLFPNQYHHCINHVVGDDLLFREADNYRHFLEKYKKYIAPITTTYAFCLMPNHFHFLIKINSETAILDYYQLKNPHQPIDKTTFDYAEFISRQFSNFFNAYAKAFNKKYERRGTLLETPFKRPLVESEVYFLNTLKYIHYNPIHHGFVDELESWDYSSYHAYLNHDKKGKFKTEVFELLDGFQGFCEIHRDFRDLGDFDEME